MRPRTGDRKRLRLRRVLIDKCDLDAFIETRKTGTGSPDTGGVEEGAKVVETSAPAEQRETLNNIVMFLEMCAQAVPRHPGELFVSTP